MHKQAAVVFLAASILAPAAVSAGGDHDGVWSVSMVTKSGDCDRSLASRIQLREGRVDQNLLFARIVGGVNSNGSVALHVLRGADSMTAKGRIVGARASGSWSAPGKNCSGSWTAFKSV